MPSEGHVVMPQRFAGHSDKFVRYRTFLQGLNLLLAEHEVCHLLLPAFLLLFTAPIHQHCPTPVQDCCRFLLSLGLPKLT